MERKEKATQAMQEDAGEENSNTLQAEQQLRDGNGGNEREGGIGSIIFLFSFFLSPKSHSCFISHSFSIHT